MARAGSSTFVEDLFAALPEPVEPDAVASAEGRREGHTSSFVLLPVTGQRLIRSDWQQILEESGVFITPSRQEFCSSFHNHLSVLDRPLGDSTRLASRGFCRVLIAQRGHGKSFLLKKLMDSGLQTTFRTIFCYLNYEATDTEASAVRCFIDLVCSKEPRLTRHLEKVTQVDQLNAVLNRLNLRAVFFIDEIEAVFGMPRDCGVPILKQLISIGELDGPRAVLAYITGNSSKVQRLCFTSLAPLTAAEITPFPSFSPQLDFNSRKYQVVCLQPISHRDELISAITAMGLCLPPSASTAASTPSAGAGGGIDVEVNVGAADTADDPSGANELALRDVLFDSRGVPQAVEQLLNSGSAGSSLVTAFEEMKRSDHSLRKVWHHVVQRLENVLGPEGFARKLEDVANNPFNASFPLVPYGPIRRDDATISETCVWDYAYKGFLSVRLDAEVDGAMAIGFLHVSDFVWAVRNLGGSINGASISHDTDLRFRSPNYQEKDCLFHSSGGTGLICSKDSLR